MIGWSQSSERTVVALQISLSSTSIGSGIKIVCFGQLFVLARDLSWIVASPVPATRDCDLSTATGIDPLRHNQLGFECLEHVSIYQGKSGR